MEHEEADELKALDATIESRTSYMIEKVMSNRGSGAGSLDSLIMVIQCLSESNKDVVQVLLRSKKDIYRNRELLELLVDYFNCTHKTLDFLNTLHEWLHGGNGVSRQLDRVKIKLIDFKRDKTKTPSSRILLERALNDFLVATNDSIITEKLRAKLGVALDDQKRLYEKLVVKKQELDHQMERLKVYRKVATAILASVYVGLMACAAVTAALSPSVVIKPLAVLAAIAAMNPIDPTSRLTNYILAKYEVKLKQRSELVNTIMGLATSRITVEDLEGMRLVVHALREKMKKFSINVKAKDAAKEPGFKAVIEDMEKKINEFSRVVKDLESKKNKCYNDILDAKKQIIRTAF